MSSLDTLRALESGKHVFVEKPLALTEIELDDVLAASERSGCMVMVGFNRRFAPMTYEVRAVLRGRAGPLSGPDRECRIYSQRSLDTGCFRRRRPDRRRGLPLDRPGTLIHGESIQDVQVLSARDRNGRAVDDVAHIAVRFSGGSTAVVQCLYKRL